MKRTIRQLGAASLLGLTLSACGGAPPAQPADLEKTGEVTLLLDFPQQSNGISAQAVPSSASSAEIKVFNGSALFATLTMTRGQTAPTTIQLAQGQTYRFETSIIGSNSKEVAWGITEHTVSGDANVALQVSSIIASATLNAGPLTGEKQDVLLSVIDPTGASLFSDFEVSYTVTGGKLLEQNRVGAVIQPTPGMATTVTATVKGLGADHQIQTFPTQAALSAAQPIGATVTGKFTNWPTTPQLSGRFVNSSSAGLAIAGNVNVDGTFTMNFPDVSGIASTSLSFRPDASVTPAGTQIAYFPTPVVEKNNIIIGSGFSAGQPDFGFVYADRDANVSWSDISCFRTYCTGSQGNLKLSKGWNRVARFPNMIESYTSMPLNSTTEWYIGITNVGDLGVTLNSDKPQVLVNDLVTYTAAFTKKNDYNILSSRFQIDLPASLEWLDNVTNATCEPPVNQQNGTLINCTTSGGSVTFQAKARDLAQFPVNPSTVRITLDTSKIYDPEPANNSASASLTRVGNAAATLNPTLDMEPPRLSVEAIKSPSVGVLMPVRGNATDNKGIDRVEIYSGASLAAAVKPDSTGVWQGSWTPGRTGVHVIRVLAYDLSGNATLQSFTVTVS